MAETVLLIHKLEKIESGALMGTTPLDSSEAESLDQFAGELGELIWEASRVSSIGISMELIIDGGAKRGGKNIEIPLIKVNE